MKQRVYIDTSVVGGCFDAEFKEWSVRLFDEFIAGKKIAVLSSVLIEELSFARDEIRYYTNLIPERFVELVSVGEEAYGLAQAYLREGAVPKKYESDALHIAVASVYRVHVLVSWNFKHIVNLDRIRTYNAVNLKMSYPTIEIRSPREILANTPE